MSNAHDTFTHSRQEQLTGQNYLLRHRLGLFDDSVRSVYVDSNGSNEEAPQHRAKKNDQDDHKVQKR